MKPDLLCNVVLFKGFSKQNGKKIRIYDEQNSMYIPFETTSFNWITNEYSLYKDHFFKIDSEKVNSGEQKQKFIKGSKKVVEVEVTGGIERRLRAAFGYERGDSLRLRVLRLERRYKSACLCGSTSN